MSAAFSFSDCWQTRRCLCTKVISQGFRPSSQPWSRNKNVVNQTQSDATDITWPYRGHASHFPFSAILGRVPEIHSMFLIYLDDLNVQAEENPWYAEQTPHTNTLRPMKWRKRYAMSKAYHENKQHRVDLLAVYLPRLCGSEAIMIVGREREKKQKPKRHLVQ